MKIQSLPGPVVAALLLWTGAVGAGAQELERGFAAPPQEARPQVWWHWMDGNITREGIRKDLEWMDCAGIGGVHCFEAGVSMAPIVQERLVYMTPAWQEAFRYAMSVADSLGCDPAVWNNHGSVVEYKGQWMAARRHGSMCRSARRPVS